MSSNVTNEQPMSKRQKTDAAENVKKGAFSVISNGTDNKHHLTENHTPPDILPVTKPETKSAANTNANNDMCSSTSISPDEQRSPSRSPSDELDNAAASNVLKALEHKLTATDSRGHEFPDLLKTSPDIASTSRSNGPVAGCSNRNNSTNSHETSSRLSNKDSNSFSRSSNVDEFQLYLMKQCLCDIDEQSLRRPFATPYYQDMKGVKYNVPLKEWPANELIQFLSNMEILFEVYLNQNAKGEICTRVMQVCDALLLQDEIIYGSVRQRYKTFDFSRTLINGIFELDEYNNKFVQYLAIKVLANCLLIAKDKETYCEELLTTLMSNLVTNHQPTDHRALGKVSFILSIILQIMEWKDIKKHPLDDQIVLNGREVYNDSDNDQYTLPINIPPIENNYFAVHHDEDGGDDETETPLAPTPPDDVHLHDNGHDRHERLPNASQRSTDPRTFSCHLQYLSDSESFDSNHLKISILGMLKDKWRSLVDNMAECVKLLQTNPNLHYIEDTVITFLTLWERIISVDTCIEYDSTLPFQFLKAFEEILINGNLPMKIYKQILTLFSAFLCYTTTLALQPVVPQETNRLAGQLFNSVRSRRIFSWLLTHEIKPENNIAFIGYKNLTVIYELAVGAHSTDANGDNEDDDEGHDDDDDDDDDDDNGENSKIALELNENFEKSIDFTLLQKLVLLILKAVAVTVRPNGGGDSSDSSMDSCSSNSSNAETNEQIGTFVEQATRDAMEELQKFLRDKLNFLPETHLSKVIVHLFRNQDDYLLEAMLCMLGTAFAFLPRHPPLINMISPVYTFLEFLELIHYCMEQLLDYLITDETCFLLYFLRFLKYIRSDWDLFMDHCNRWQSNSNSLRSNSHSDSQPYTRIKDVLIALRMRLDRLVQQRLFPYDISPLITQMRICESNFDGLGGL